MRSKYTWDQNIHLIQIEVKDTQGPNIFNHRLKNYLTKHPYYTITEYMEEQNDITYLLFEL